MAELLEGQAVLIQGSASKPYQLKNVAGVLSCSCPAWRNQSLPIDRRSCKHLRTLLGAAAAEDARLGQILTKMPAKGKPEQTMDTWKSDEGKFGRVQTGREENIMGARNKLNVAVLYTSLAIAGVAGWVTHSWLVFGLVMAVLIVGNLHSGNIRPTSRQP